MVNETKHENDSHVGIDCCMDCHLNYGIKMHLCNIPIDIDNTINKGDGCIVSTNLQYQTRAEHVPAVDR
jgi:hypothetical protein